MVKFEQIKGFIFDLDGVIANTSVFHAKAWHQLADKLGVTWTEDLANQLKGVGRMDSLNLILKSGGKENDYTEDEKIKYATEKNDNYLSLLKGLTDKDILPGMKEFIEDLSANNYLISLASSSKNSPKVLEALDLEKYFDARVDPSTLKNGKPDPEIYVRGAEVLNLRPEECIGLEDAVSGIKSVNGAHETSVGIGDPEILNEADINFTDTSQVTLANIKKAMN
ncbi:beta-phosphoglucomutase [Companilactobacillus paralimentarius DSM 13238 = JCM 10415]|jgi:beta-phosphoglucomutase|uniref:Beta-phosphoglucomutase n=1 Tax=Companilactobacillus paralimentarius DSM 13238 = JCM 10415 TaxID=1122151 RepID=A0A0R1PEW3_9LACO|nr:beta-phosphoglucomutase [Companilactobacillus paralimentarius]KAE9564655.1 beta-phosphoglucomutase [Companilactobacillus paralimentarius]KRL30703.1 beta-phosphoglucomutase [Companilactobacillus paralimentarius DSM 13238 = JCM 10415]QFR70553.1 beta-phosphoglucomutase [Companilactobacillus paralimentarius]